MQQPVPMELLLQVHQQLFFNRQPQNDLSKPQINPNLRFFLSIELLTTSLKSKFSMIKKSNYLIIFAQV